VFIILDVKKNECIPEYFSSSPISKIVRGFLINLESKKVNIFEMYRVGHYAEIYFISTGKEYRGIGLAREMTRGGLEIIDESVVDETELFASFTVRLIKMNEN